MAAYNVYVVAEGGFNEVKRVVRMYVHLIRETELSDESREKGRAPTSDTAPPTTIIAG